MKKSLQSKKVLLSLAATSALWSGFAVAGVEITPTVDISNMYLYRGENLGCAYGECSAAQISGGVKASMEGAYVGVWGTSAQSGEYDVYAGFNQELADKLSVDVSVWTYTYPHDSAYDTFGQYTELYVTLAYDNFWATVIDNVADQAGNNDGYMYFAVGGSYEQFSATLGYADPDTTRYELSNTVGDANYAGLAKVDYAHLDLTYAYNERVKFTVSQIVHQDDLEVGNVKYEDLRDEDTLFVVVYSVPLK